METPIYRHKVELLSTPFQVPDQYLFFSRARLFADRIELSGWSSRGTYRRTILLDRICNIEWNRSGSGSPDTFIRLDDGADIVLHLDHFEQWKWSLEQRLRWSPWRRLAAIRAGRSVEEMPLNDLISCSSDSTVPLTSPAG